MVGYGLSPVLAVVLENIIVDVGRLNSEIPCRRFAE